VFREVSDELLVEIGESEEGLYICWSGPFSNTGNLDWVHHDRVVRDDHSEVLDCGFLELAFVGMEVKLMFLQKLQNTADDLLVIFKGLCEDEDVVQIDHNHAFQDVLSGDRISHFNMVRTSVSTSCQWTSASPCSAEADARHMDHIHPWYMYPIPTLLPKTG